MMFRIFLISSLLFSVQSVAVDEFLLSTVRILIPKVQLSCKNTNLTIGGQLFTSASSECQADGSTLLIASTQFPAIEKISTTVGLISSQTIRNSTAGLMLEYSYSLSGVLSFNQTLPSNTLQSSITNLKGNVTLSTTPYVKTTPAPRTRKPTTTRRPKTTKTTTKKPKKETEALVFAEESAVDTSTAVLTMTWIHVKFDEGKKSASVRNIVGSTVIVIVMFIKFYLL